jgi:predicted transcriptional regulator
MNDLYPQWTAEIIENTVAGEDQLGIEGAAQSYQQEILPGIITVTDHARYYSFYAWILYRFIFGKESKRLIKDFRGTFFKRHEMALILSGYLHHSNGNPFSGIVGSGTNNVKVKRFWGTADPVSLDQDYFQNKEGGFGQYYRTAMMAMGIIEEQEEPRLVYRLTERGKALAEAYQASISDTKYFQNLETHGQISQISKQDAEEYAQVGCLCPEAINHGQDRKLLLDTFFRLDEPPNYNNPHVRRRNSLGVALDIVYQAKGQFQRDQLRPALYIGEYSPGIHYLPANDLTNWVHRWKMVEVRHMFTFGLQCLWAAFLLELRSKTDIKKEDWKNWVQNQLIESEWNLSVPQLAEKFCAEAGLSGDYGTLLSRAKKDFGMGSGLDEYSLYVNAYRNQTNPVILFKTGIRILLQLFLRYFPEYHNQDPIWKEMADKPRLPLVDYFHSMDGKLKDLKWSVMEWVPWIYQEYIFEQHEMIALEKFRYQEYDTFKFYYEDGIFHWPTGKTPYQEPIRLAGNRLNNCITMLVDLGLILQSDRGFLSLSSEGEVYREKILEGFRNAD